MVHPLDVVDDGATVGIVILATTFLLCLAADLPPTASAPAELHTSIREPWSRGVDFGFGLAPGAVVHRDGFAPLLRYDVELGLRWTSGRRRISVGADAKLVQVFDRKRVGGGVDAMLTAGWGPAYVRGGLGVMTGLPATRVLGDARPAIGGLVGIGLASYRDHFGGRIGVDYDLRLDSAGRPIQSVFISLRFEFG